jgi:hypothetical protein
MKEIEIRLFEIDDNGLLHQAVHQMSYDRYKEYLILYKQNILEDIINELEFKLNMLKNGN